MSPWASQTSKYTSDPLAPLWTAENWRLWLIKSEFILWLAKRHQRFVCGSESSTSDPSPELLGQVLGLKSDCHDTYMDCKLLPPRQRMGWETEGQEGGETVERKDSHSGCMWWGCESHREETEAPVRLLACKGCGEVRYCGRDCQRMYVALFYAENEHLLTFKNIRDWLKGGHKKWCGRRVKSTWSESRVRIPQEPAIRESESDCH